MGLLNQDVDALKSVPYPGAQQNTYTPPKDVDMLDNVQDVDAAKSVVPGTGVAPATGVTGGLNTPEPSILSQDQPGTIINPVTGMQPNQTLYNYTGSQATPTDLMMKGPNLRTVNPETETVQGQLAGILQADSPLMQLAKRQGLEQAQRRGLLNTSLAAESAQVGMMREAMPVAQQDAAAYLKQGMTNQQFENQFLGNVQQAGLQNWLSAAGDERKMAEMQQQFENDRQLMSDEYGFKAEETAGKQNAALWAQFIQAAGDINQADMSLKAKQEQIAALKESTLSGMALNAKQFNDPQMYDWIVGQMNNVAGAVKKAVSGTSGAGLISGATNQQTYNLPAGQQTGLIELTNGQTTYKPGEQLPYGYTWGVDPATGQFGIIANQ